MKDLVPRLGRLNPLSVLVAIVVGAALFVLSRRYGAETGGEEAAGWIAAVVAFFLRAEKASAEKANAAPTEHVNGSGALAPEGGREPKKTVAMSSDLIAAKREILMTWAKAGREITDVEEAAAEIAALEVIERSGRSIPVDVPEKSEG